MREREGQSTERPRGSARREGGFTVLQTIIACAVVAITASFAFMGIASARTSMRVQSSARKFAGFVEKARSDAIRRHGTASVQITTTNATSYTVTMDFNLDGTTETRTISLESDVHINSDAASLTFDWRGRLTGEGLSLSFEGPDGSYAVQLDVTGSGDVTIGEEKFLDSEVPNVTLNNGGAGGDVLSDVSSLTPASPTTPPVTVPPVTVPPVTVPPVTTPPVTTPPVTTPPVTTPPVTVPPVTPPATTPPSTTPPSTTPPSTTPPSTTPPASGTSCTMTVDFDSITINACNNGGQQCGSKVVKVTLVGAATGATVSATTIPSNLRVTAGSVVGGAFNFTIAAKNNTRTTNTVTFTGTSCGTKDVSVKTQ